MHLRFSTVSGNVARSTETVIMRRTADVALKVTGVQATPQVAQWDGIRVLRHVGLAMLQRLSNANTPVIVDPVERALYFLVPAGAADHWHLPDQYIADIRRHVALPPAHQRIPPGRYWLVYRRARAGAPPRDRSVPPLKASNAATSPDLSRAQLPLRKRGSGRGALTPAGSGILIRNRGPDP